MYNHVYNVKQDCDRVLAYRKHHAGHDGVFYNPIEEQYYVSINLTTLFLHRYMCVYKIMF